MKGSEFKLKLLSGEEVVVMAHRALASNCYVVGEDSVLRPEKIPVNPFMIPNRYRYLPSRLFGDFPKRRVVAIKIKIARKNRTQVRYSVHATNGTVEIFTAMKRAISHIFSLGTEFDSMFVLYGLESYKVLTASGLPPFAFDKARPPKFSMKTLKREWKRIEKKISV